MNETGLDVIFNHMTEGLIVINPSGEILFYNEMMASFDIKMNQPIRQGSSLFNVVPSGREAFVRSIIHDVATNKRTQIIEAEYKNNKGQNIVYEITYNPVFNEEKVIDKIFIVLREITHQKAFESKATQLLNDLARLIETANAFIFGLDGRGYITEWNKECVRITGFEKNDVYTQHISRIIDEDNLIAFLSVLERVNQGEPVSNIELQIRTKHDRNLYILLNATPRVNAEENVIGVLFVGQDITELLDYRFSLEQKVKDNTIKLQKALKKEKELVEVKNKFISVASHEFKIPLGSIASSVQVLKRNKALSTDEKEKLENIDLQVSLMKSLLEDVLSSGKLQATTLKSNLQKVELISLLKQIIDEVVSSQETHIVCTDFPSGQLYIESDEKLLRNIFINILSNAIKFSPGQNHVDLKVFKSREWLTVSVQDFGIGIDSDDINQVFEPFTRGSNINNIKGSGLGLSIVKKAVETLEGDLIVDSEPGSGTTFTVRIRNSENKQ